MKGQMLKLFVVIAVCLSIAAGCMVSPPTPAPTPVPPTSTPDPAAPVQAWVDALNSGDVDAALAPFTDDVKFSVFEYYASNKDGLRGIFDWLAGLETKYQIKECQTKEDQVVCTMPVSDACIAGYDPVDGLMTTMTFVLTQDGKIAQANGRLDGFNDYYVKWISPGTTWMRANRAEELAKVESTSDGREAGAIQAKLCKEYGESLKATPTAAGATKPAGKQVLLVVGLEQSEDMELMLTKEVAVMVSMLEKAGCEVVVASASGEPITGGTTTLTPDLKLADVKVDDYVGFMFPCLAVDMDLPPPAEAVRIAKEAVARGKPVAAQVGGVVTLAVAGVLEGKKFAFPEDPGAYMPGGIYKGTGVVQDGNIITSGTCPYMAREMGRTDGTSELTQKFIDLLAATQEATPAAATSDQLKVVQAYYAALNSGAVDAALALFTDDVKFRGENYATGKEMLRGVFDWLAGTEVKHGPPDCQSQNDRVVCAFSIGDACIAASGATDGLPAQGEYLIQPDGKIREASESLGGAGWDDYIQWDNSFQGWAMLNRTEEWRGFGKSKEFAPRLIKLCKEYGASLKSAPTSTPIPSTPAPSSDLEKLAMSFADAFNRRDVDAALALFVDDGLNYMWDGWKTNNKEDVRSGLEYMIGRGANLTFADCAPKGKALGCTLEWRDDYCQKAWTGLDVARHDLTLSAQGNKIKLFSAMRTAEVDKAYYESYLKLIDWAEANRPDDWKKVKAPVAYDLSGQPLGELESSLCKAYLEATKK